MPDADSAKCSICGDLPQTYLAQTGYGDFLPEAAHKLVSIEVDNQQHVRRCPECGAYFHWEDLPQYYGSGNLDEERLSRMSRAQGELVEALREPDFGGRDPRELAIGAHHDLPEGLGHAILTNLSFHSKTFPALVPALVGLLIETDCQRFVTLLVDWAGKRKERHRELIELIEKDGRPLRRFGQIALDFAKERGA